jgi:hypothetical protein
MKFRKTIVSLDPMSAFSRKAAQVGGPSPNRIGLQRLSKSPKR